MGQHHCSGRHKNPRDTGQEPGVVPSVCVNEEGTCFSSLPRAEEKNTTLRTLSDMVPFLF